MSRTIHANTVAEITARKLTPIIMIKAEFTGGTVLFWSGVGSLVYNAETYTGAGNLLNIGSVKEGMNVEANGSVITLTGISATLISLALTEDYQGKPITIFFACLDSVGALISSPFILFKGFMDVLQIDTSGETATLSMQIENRLIDLNRAKVRRYTMADQNVLYPNDRGLDFVTALQEQEITWGKPTAGA